MSKKPALSQSENGYRYSLDPFLLADGFEAEEPHSAIDLGTGNGILLLLLNKRYPDATLWGIDIQHTPLIHAARNGEAFEPRLLQGDIAQAEKLFPAGRFDLVVSNPPFRKKNAGRINPVREKAVARHELLLTLDQLVASARYLLRDGGLFSLVHLAERSAEVLHALGTHRFAARTVRFAHSRAGDDAFLVTVHAVKNGKNPVVMKPPLVVYDKNGDYTDEMKRIYESFDI